MAGCTVTHSNCILLVAAVWHCIDIHVLVKTKYISSKIIMIPPTTVVERLIEKYVKEKKADGETGGSWEMTEWGRRSSRDTCMR